MNGGGKKDALVVRTEDLAPYVREFVDKFDGEHPISAQNFGQVAAKYAGQAQVEAMPAGFGGASYIAQTLVEEGGYSESSARSIVGRVVRCTYQWTSLGIVDLICTGMGRPDIMRNLNIVPNPQWSRERYERWQQEEGRICDE